MLSVNHVVAGVSQGMQERLSTNCGGDHATEISGM